MPIVRPECGRCSCAVGAGVELILQFAGVINTHIPTEKAAVCCWCTAGFFALREEHRMGCSKVGRWGR